MSNSNNEFVLKLMALLDRQKSKSQINNDIKELEKVLRKVRLVATFTKGTTKNELNQTIKQIETQLRQVKLQAKIDNRQLNREIDNVLRNMSARDIQLNFNSNGERLNAQVRRTISQAREFADRNPIRVNIDLKKEKLLNQLTAFTNKNTKITESSYWLGEVERLRGVISSVTDRDSLRNATDQFQVFTSGVRATGYAAVSTTDRIKGMLSNVLKIGNYFGLAFTAVNKFRQSLSNLKEMDTLLSEISKTSEMTVKQLEKLGDRSYSIASKYGVLANNFMKSFQEMSRAGFGEDKAQSLAELSTLAQSAGNLTADLANEYLIASNAAYGYSGNVEQLNALLDAQNQVTNRNAVSMTELADATKVAANQLANAAISEQEMTALLGTGIATTKESGKVVGRAVKAIVMNLQQVKNTDEGLETTAEDLGKVESCLGSLGIKMKETADGITRLRNPLAILSELAEVYNSLPEDSVERANIISDIGGKYRGNVLSSILSNWETYIKMMGDYEDAAGSALREAEKSADSWEGRIAQLSNSWDAFVSSVTSKETVKGSISFLDGMIQSVTKLTDAIGTIPVLMATVNGSMTALNKNYGLTKILNKDTKKIDIRGNIMGFDISAYRDQVKHFREASEAMQRWNDKLANGTADINTFGSAVVQNNAQLKAYLQTTSVDAPASLNGYKSYLNAAGVSTDALRLKTVLLNTAISFGIGAAIQIAMKGISLLVKKVDEMAHSAEHCKERVDELMSSYQSAIDKANSNAKTVEELASKYETLSKGVNNLGQNVSLTADEYSEYNDIVNQIADMFPTLIQGYTNEGNAILKLKGNVEQLRDAYKEAQQAAYNTLITSGKDSDGNDIIENYHNVLSNDNPFVKLDSSAKEYIDIINSFREAMLASDETYDKFYKDMISGGKLINEYNMSQAQFNEVKDVLTNIGFKAELSDEDRRNINSNAKAYIQTYQAEISSALKNVQTIANAYLMTNEDYANLNEQSKNAASIIVNSVNEGIASGFENKEDVGAYVTGIIDTIKDNHEVQDALVGLFKLDITDMQPDKAKELVDQYINFIAKVLEESPLELKARLGFGDVDAIAENYREVTSKAAEKFSKKPVTNLLYGGKIYDPEYLAEKEALDKFAEENSINTQDEIAFWNQCIEESDTREEAMEKYLNSSFNNSEQISLSITQTIDQLNTRFKPAFDSLQSAYQDIFADDEFAINSIDILSTCDSIKSKLDDLNEIEGITVDYSSFENFVKVLNNTESSEQDVETAFDSLATSITQAALSGAEDFELMKSALEDLGVANNEMVAFDALIKNTEALKEAGLDLADATDKEIQEFTDAVVSTENYDKALSLLRIQKILCAENPLSTADDIQNLYMLAEAAGIATNAIQALMALNTAYTKASAEGNTLAATAVKGQMELVKKQVMDQFANLGSDVDFKNIGGGSKSASKAGSSAGDAYVDAFEEELKALEELRDNGLISEKEYLDRLRVLYERYFKDKLGYEKEFAKYQKQYLDGYKSLYESIFSHASKLISDRIDMIEDEKDKAVDAFEEQKKAAEDSYNAQIKLLEDKKKALQDEIDKIKEANEDREEAIDLQEKQLAYEKAKNQKTILQYTEDRGFIYATDDEAIQDAKNELDSAKADAEIRALEKQQDALDKQIEAIQEMLDASNEYWDTQIEQTEKYYDTIIKGMEEYKNRWDELSDLQEHAEMIGLLKELGLTEEDLLNESSGAFDRLRTSYLGILKDLNTGNQGVIDGLSQLADIDMGSIPSFLGEMQGYIDSISNMDVTALSDGLNEVGDGFSNIASSASDAASSISGGGASAPKSNGTASENGSQDNANNTGNGSSLTEAIGKLAQDGVQEITKISNAFAGEDEEGTSVTGAIQKVIDKVGSPDTESGDSESLISTLSEQTAQALDEENGIPAQKTAWEEMNTPLNDAVDSITTLQSTLEDMDGKEFTVTLNMVGNAASLGTEILSKFATSGNAKAEGTADIKGTANAKGNWGAKEGGRTLVGELGQEIWVHSADGTFETVGDNGAEFINTKKGDIIFNHLQTKQLLDKGSILSRGKTDIGGTALADGNADNVIITPDGVKLVPLQPGDKMWDMVQKFNAYMERIDNNVEKLVPNSFYDHNRQMNDIATRITNSSVINNNRQSQAINQEIHVTLPNVTNSTSADALLKDLQSLAGKKYQAFIK